VEVELDEPLAPAPPVEVELVLVLEPPPPTSPPPELEELELEAGSSPPHAAMSARQEKTKTKFNPSFMTDSFCCV
jgi:hypothetical protein